MAIVLEPSKRIGKKTKTAKTSEIEKARKRIESVDQDEKSSFVIYGRNKTGKTKFACDSKLKTLVIDCNERGTITVRKMAPRVQRYRVNRWEDLDPIYWLLKSGDHDFEVIVIDTVTSLAALCMKWVLKEQDDRDFNRDPQTPDQRSWGKMGEHITDVIVKFRNLPYHTVFTAQEKETTNEEEDGTTSSLIHPELSPRPRSTLLSAVSLIGRLYVAETVNADGKKIYERRMLVGPHPNYVSGGRFEDSMKRIERNPTLGKFLKTIYGGE